MSSHPRVKNNTTQSADSHCAMAHTNSLCWLFLWPAVSTLLIPVATAAEHKQLRAADVPVSLSSPLDIGQCSHRNETWQCLCLCESALVWMWTTGEDVQSTHLKSEKSPTSETLEKGPPLDESTGQHLTTS